MLMMPNRRSANDLGTAYFQASRSNAAVAVSRAQEKLQVLLGTVIDDPGNVQERWRRIENEPPVDSTILLCTTFLPPVTHSWRAVERFYSSVGTSQEALALLKKKHSWEWDRWKAHSMLYQRIDILDRGLIEEYFAQPDYYQMLLTPDELEEQLANFRRMLDFGNYTVALTPEAVGLPFEIRGSEVRIRTDRRNKGQPRASRVDGLVLHDIHLAEVFEREFWNLFRLTEPEFKDKNYIFIWLEKLAEKRRVSSIGEAEYDVFVCYNSSDRAAVRRIAEQLRARGVRPWFDEWNLMPGRPWQRALEAEIQRIKAAAVFVSGSGVAPWMQFELDAFLREFVKRGCPVIPVILPSVKEVPDIPVFLRGFQWVDFRRKRPAPLDQLIWGITGKRRE